MKFNIENHVGARFKLIAHKGDGVPVRETEWFNNLVLDAGLARMSIGTWIGRCCVGTGSSVPVTTQVRLDNFLASTTTQQASSTAVQVTTLPYYYSASTTWRFNQGVAAGNISEVGLGWGDSNLWNRALIKDQNKNPTTITVLSDEYLDVVSEIRVYPAGNQSGSFNLLDKTGHVIGAHTYTVSAFINNPRATFDQVTSDRFGVYTGIKNNSVTSAPSSILLSSALQNSITYPTPTSMRVVKTLALGEANGIHQSFFLSVCGVVSASGGSATNPEYYPGYKFQISPTISKSSSQSMTYTFEMSWGRYEST